MILRLVALLATFSVIFWLPSDAVGQSFSPEITVNGEGISGYELEQRFLLLEALRVPGSSREQAADVLIDDRLKRQAARAIGLEISQDELEAGIAEFAQRGNLSAAEFIEALGESGVAPETVRDFVEAGLLWRTLVRGRFGPRSNVSEAEVERALALSGTRSGARILLSEIILPTATPEMEAQANSLAEELRVRITNQAQFAEAARRFSVAPSRENGGRRDWVALSELPPQLSSLLLTLAPGEVSESVPLGDQAIGLFQVRALEERRAQAEGGVSVEYATLALPADPAAAAAQAQELRQTTDTCDDLYTVARGLPQGALRRETVPSGSVPGALSSALSNLDPNESAQVNTAQGPVFVMLCSRVSEVAEDGLEQVRAQLRNQRLSTYADSYLEELRADANIVR